MNLEGEGVGFCIKVKKADPLAKKNPLEMYLSDDKNGPQFVRIDDKSEDVFQIIPLDEKKRKRTSIYICGRNGSGKSYVIKQYLLQFMRLYPDYPIYLFSSKNEDENFDGLPIKRIPIDDSCVKDPFEYTTFAHSMVIFDDIDGLIDGQRKAIYHLRDIILQNGRSNYIHIISTNHDATGKDVKAPLNESDMVIFFPANYNNTIRYLMEGYVGLNPTQIKYVLDMQTRAITFIKTFPNLLVTEKVCTTIKGIDHMIEYDLKNKVIQGSDIKKAYKALHK